MKEEVEGSAEEHRLEKSSGLGLIADWESWDSDNENDNDKESDEETDKEQDEFQDCQTHQHQLPHTPAPAPTQQVIKYKREDEGIQIQGIGAGREERREYTLYLYLNTIPLLGALYGMGRLVFYQQQDNGTQVTASLWGISKNVLNSLTLTAGALLVPLNIPDLIAASVATGLLEGIVDTLLEYYQSSRKERQEMTVEEILYNVLNHAPIIGIIYDVVRLSFFLKQRDKDEVKKSLWGLVANSVTTAITILSVIKFSLKATGSIPSGMARSAQAKVTFTLAKKGVTAPVVQAGKVLATKEVRRLKKRIKVELAELKTKIKDVETEKFLRSLGLSSTLKFDESDCRFHLRKRLKSFIDSKKSSEVLN